MPLNVYGKGNRWFLKAQMNAKQAYALRADTVYLLRRVGYSYKELAVIFRTTREPINKLEARGARSFYAHGLINLAHEPCGVGPWRTTAGAISSPQV